MAAGDRRQIDKEKWVTATDTIKKCDKWIPMEDTRCLCMYERLDMHKHTKKCERNCVCIKSKGAISTATPTLRPLFELLSAPAC